jgi:hypothetical protein
LLVKTTMKVLVACTILALLGVVYSQCTATRHFSDSDEAWDFTGYAAAEVRGAALFRNQEPYSFVVKFCTNVNVLIGNVSNPNKTQKDWIGWSHGSMESFSYVGMEMHNPNTAQAQVSSRVVKKSFEQDFIVGDHGYPCVTGRKATLYLYCGQSGDTCANVPGANDQQPNCMDGSSPTSGQLCMCAAGYDPSEACNADITLLLLDCPTVFITPNAQSPQASEPLSGGAVFGIIVLVLFLVTLVICAGGFAYNYKVNDLRGVDAVPFISVFRGSARDRPYQPASQSGYGAVEEQ